MNKGGLLYWIIIIFVLLVLSGAIYFKLSSSGVEIGPNSNNSIKLGFNGTIEKTNITEESINITPPDTIENISIIGRE
jgi:hypothetical protein